MIEVEKKFQPTQDQLSRLLKDAILIKEKIMHDIYYDFSDFRLFKMGKKLRKRDSGFELKVSVPTQSGVAVAYEYVDELEILRILKIEGKSSLEDVVQKNMEVLCDFKTIRKEYVKNDFIIDVDEMNFGVGVTEIELLVESENLIPGAERKILDFAKSVGIEPKELPLKTEMYLQKMKPVIHKLIFATKQSVL